MRVLLVSDNYLPNRDGVATSVVSLATGLRELGHDVAVVAPRAAPSTPTAQYPTYLVPSFPTGQGGYRCAAPSPKVLGRIIQAHRPDVVHIHTLGALGLLAAAACRRTGLKCVLTWHTDLLAYRKPYPLLNLAIPAIYAGSLLPGKGAEVARTLGRTAVAAALLGDVSSEYREMLSEVLSLFDRVIVPSDKSSSAVLEMAPDQIPYVIPTAAVRHGPLGSSAKRELRVAQERIHQGDSVIACVGRLSGEKNTHTLLLALSRYVLPAVPDARLNLIGDGAQRKTYQRLADRLGISHAVAFAGSVSPELVGHLLSSSALLAHPSLTETQGMVITEAALSGVPAVVLDAGLAGVVQHGDTGYITSSTPCFADALVRLLERLDLRHRLGDNARRLAAEYTPARYASRVADVYHEAIHSGSPLTSALLRDRTAQ
ncbi:glycosyltransferase [Actinomadura sp. 7K507]|uniref:glycosyltransferase n=1 Tax=Actinomadura sp. 7K507 TaxID=2530365 RepID=UPI00104FCB39|nr:glycosyltransferase [Actinomadura sp. 7K507]TDC84257.1 glycosyltransferase [Actinomadura sp. 7K507]